MDSFDLERFVFAQDRAGTYRRALDELRRGRKESHWIWFVFPQIVGLGHSAMSRKFGISSLDEAELYLRHLVLGPRLVECSTVLAQIEGRSAEQILGSIDAKKLQSSMTLFLRASPGPPPPAVFGEVLDKYFQGCSDMATDALL